MHVASNSSSASRTNARAFQLTLRELDGPTSVLTVAGELDLSTAPRLKSALSDVLEAGATRIILDLALVSFMDSTALGVLVGAQRSLGAGGRFAMVCPGGELMRMFELTGLVGAFELFPTLEKALAYVGVSG